MQQKETIVESVNTKHMLFEGGPGDNLCEQNLAGVGIGMACRDRTVVFMSTFACFFSRAFDNFRMGIISQTNINVAGSHCGVSIGNYIFSRTNFLKTILTFFELTF